MFNFRQLDKETRDLMIDEFKLDVESGSVYLSKRFSPDGEVAYPELMTEAMRGGTEDTLTSALTDANAFNATELRSGKPVQVPVNAAATFAEGEFGRYYARAICRRAILNGSNEVEVYRAKSVDTARARSEDLIGTRLPALTLLDDLRTNVGMDTALGLPPGPNSGLSVFFG